MGLNELTSDGLVSPSFIRFYSAFQDAAMVVSLCAFALSCTTIFRASPKGMGVYRWFLLNEVVWNLFFDLLLYSWKMVPLFPALCVYSSSFLLGEYSVLWSRIALFLMAFSCVGKSVGIMAGVLYRHMHATPPNTRLFQLYIKSTPWNQIWTFLVLEAIVTPAFFYTDGQERAILQKISSESEVMRAVFALQPSTLCLTADRPPVTIFVFALVPCLAITLLISVLLFRTHRNLREHKRTFRVNDQKLEYRLLVACEYHLLGSCLFLLLPLLVILAAAFFGIPRSNHAACVAASVASVHSMVDCFILIRCIRPYRHNLLFL
ncbi:hypothetical protein M3Y99_00770200 [Aphelenchoides fujianensis]|nr:hypothetical protein M3Y99_00770200 [Aphelenchoides fujianensis]